LGSDSLPYLDEIIKSGSPLAPNAAYLVGLIKSRKSVPILLRAAKSPMPSVRLSVALTASNLEIADKDSDRLLKFLERDNDDMVRVGVNKARIRRGKRKMNPPI
jgi:HEAT repeat protein